MAEMVRDAAKLVAKGCFPGIRNGRRSEFIARCAQALRQRGDAETTLKNLPKEDQASIRRSLAGEKEACQGCLNEACLDKETEWVTVDTHRGEEVPMPFSRCAHCKMPKCFGRTGSGLAAVLAPSLRRELGKRTYEFQKELRGNKRARIDDIE